MNYDIVHIMARSLTVHALQRDMALAQLQGAMSTTAMMIGVSRLEEAYHGVYKAIKIRLDPTPSQERQLSSHVGAARTTYNIILAHVKEELDAGRKVSMSMYSLRDWFKTVRDEQAPWWKENSSDVYAYGAQCVANGLSNYFSSRSGKRAGKKVQFPKFKSKSTARKAFSYSAYVKVKDAHGLYLPRVGRVHTFENVQQHLGDRHIVRASISQSPTGKWFASVTYRVNDYDTIDTSSSAHKKTAVGVDWGVKH